MFNVFTLFTVSFWNLQNNPLSTNDTVKQLWHFLPLWGQQRICRMACNAQELRHQNIVSFSTAWIQCRKGKKTYIDITTRNLINWNKKHEQTKNLELWVWCGVMASHRSSARTIASSNHWKKRRIWVKHFSCGSSEIFY